MRNLVQRSIHQSDDLVVEFKYKDKAGKLSRRVVSPIRFTGQNRFLGLCLSRTEPRQFCLDRCESMSLKLACDYVMPVVFAESN